MKVVAISDIHGFLPEIPPCDLLLVAGDVCPVWNHRAGFQLQWLLRDFSNWLESVPARKVIGVWGNHDRIAEDSPRLVKGVPWTCLADELVEWEGLRIYGLPWQLRFFDWAFNLDAPELAEKYNAIPDCDIIISHGPPYGYGDFVPRDGERVGCPAFTEAIDRIQPKLAVFGHIHCDPGAWTRGDTKLANVSLLDDAYRVTRGPAVFDL